MKKRDEKWREKNCQDQYLGSSLVEEFGAIPSLPKHNTNNETPLLQIDQSSNIRNTSTVVEIDVREEQKSAPIEQFN